MGLLDGFAKLIPGAASMPEDERRALAMQGLLSMGAGILANNHGNYGKAGPAIGAGISQGLLAMNKGADDLADRKYRAQVMAQQAAGPAEFVAMDRMARAAGYDPGTDGYKDFFRRRNGEISKASNAGFGFDQWTDAYGNVRPKRNNPRNGQVEVYYDEHNQWVPLGPAPQPEPQPPAPQSKATYGADLPPEVRAYIMANEQAFASAPDGANIQIPPPVSAAIPGLGRGRSKEAEAAAVAAAQRGVELSTLPAELQIRTNAAIEQAGGAAAAANQADRDNVQAQREINAERALGLLREAETLLPGSTGSLVGAGADLAASTVGASTKGAEKIAALKTIAGQLVSQMPRMEGPQSDKDVQLYKDMAGDLANPLKPVKVRKAALEQLRRLQDKYAPKDKAPGGAEEPPAPANPNRTRIKF